VNELETRLVALGRELDWPEPPNLVPLVRARLAPEPPRRPLFRRKLVLALAAVAVAFGAALAVPQSRAAILEFFGLRGVRIERTPEPPVVPPATGAETPEPPGALPATGANLGLGVPTTLAEARRRVDYEVVAPDEALVGPPREVWFNSAPGDGQVALVYWRKDDPPTILFTQFRASSAEFIEKLAGPETTIEPVDVNGEPGFWLAGEPHAFFYRGPDGEVREETFRLAGNVLLWEGGELTLRLEGAPTKAEALRIARSVG
jgi:hypothetical protein